MTGSRRLKKDVFGEVSFVIRGDTCLIVRDVRSAVRPLRWLARRLMRREAAILRVLAGTAGVPALLSAGRHTLERSFIPGLALYEARPADPAFYRAALRLLVQLHRRRVVHNDLAKEPNILVRPCGLPAFIDFQLAWAARHRGRLFRLLAYEDLRHLLKHKRSYCPDALTARQRRILAAPSPPSRLFRHTVKPAYLFVTRRLLGWSDREGAGDRGRT